MAIACKANARARLILKCFSTREPSLLAKAFVVFVRPLLEYASVVWAPHLTKDIDLIENVQRKFTKSLSDCKNLSYDSRLKFLSLDSLYCRRIKADLILCYKVLHNIVTLNDGNQFLTMTHSKTRANHSWKLVKPRPLATRDLHSLNFRVVDIWNSLSADVVDSSSVDSFKHKLKSLSLCKFDVYAADD